MNPPEVLNGTLIENIINKNHKGYGLKSGDVKLIYVGMGHRLHIAIRDKVLCSIDSNKRRDQWSYIKKERFAADKKEFCLHCLGSHYVRLI
jgi:hypothetical protein